MAYIEVYEKKPAEVQDYDISFVTWLSKLNTPDTAASITVTADSGITLLSSALTAGVVKLWMSGGSVNNDYAVTITLVTTGGRTIVEQVQFQIRG